MAIKNTDKLFGEPIKGSLEKFLAVAPKNTGTRSVVPLPTPPSPAVNMEDPSGYIILPGRNHGTYEYPDFLVARHRLGYDANAEKAAKQLGFDVANSGTEQNGAHYIGNINWEQALTLNAKLGNTTLTPRQFIDFKEHLEQGLANKVIYDGTGRKISNGDVQSVYNEIFEVRDPWRSEWLSAKFIENNRDMYMYTEHSLTSSNQLLNGNGFVLNGHITEDTLVDTTSFSNEGLPTKKSRAQKLYYWFPRSGAVARFDAYSDGIGLSCSGDPQYANSALGVRAARKKS